MAWAGRSCWCAHTARSPRTRSRNRSRCAPTARSARSRSWIGQAPANQVLTAYGIEEFSDMARVYPIDKRVIERTQNWLIGRQRSDGSWAPDTQFINEGATNHFNSDVVRITAYIAGALEHT